MGPNKALFTYTPPMLRDAMTGTNGACVNFERARLWGHDQWGMLLLRSTADKTAYVAERRTWRIIIQPDVILANVQ